MARIQSGELGVACIAARSLIVFGDIDGVVVVVCGSAAVVTVVVVAVVLMAADVATADAVVSTKPC